MTTRTTPLGLASTQIYDFAYIGNLDMEPNLPKFGSGGTYVKGKDGYVILNITSISWTTTYTGFDPIYDNIFLNLDISGYDPEVMSPAKDAAGKPLQRYRISAATGTITFGAGNPAKYVWVVTNGEIQGASLEDDLTFNAARLVVSLQQNNQIPSDKPVSFTITYTLDFVDLGTAITSATTATQAVLSVDDSRGTHTKVISKNVMTATESGYLLFKLGDLTSTSTVPVRTNDFIPKVDDVPPVFSIALNNGNVLHNQYAARHWRQKNLSATNPKFALFAVNQGKIGANGETLDTNYQLVKLKLAREQSNDQATVTLNYGLSSVVL